MQPQHTAALNGLYDRMSNPPLAHADWCYLLATILQALPDASGVLVNRDAETWQQVVLAELQAMGAAPVDGAAVLLEQCMQRGESLYFSLDDPAGQSLTTGDLLLPAGTRLAWPLLAGKVVVGALLLEFAGDAALDTPALGFLQLAGRQVGWAIETSRLRKQDAHRSLLLDINIAVSRKIASILDFGQLLQETVLLLQSLLNRHLASIFLLEPGGQTLRLAASAGPGVLGKIRVYEQRVTLGLLGRCITTQKPIVANDVRADPGYVGGDVPEARAELDVPICFEDQIFGVLTLIDTLPDTFTPDDLLIAQAVADQVAVSLRNAQLHTATQEHLQQLSAIYDISLEIITRLDMDDLLREITRRAMPLLGADGAGIYLSAPQTDELHLVIAFGILAPFVGTHQAVDIGAAGRVFRTQAALVLTNYAEWPERIPIYNCPDAHTGLLGVPLTYAGQRLGVLLVTSLDLEHPFTETETRLATLFASQATVAIANARLHAELREQASRDSLTGLWNRRHFVDTLRQFSEGLDPAVVIMIDVDGLKQANDTQGHAAGDRLLQRTSDLLLAQLDPRVILARLGGDEFAAVLPDDVTFRTSDWLRSLLARVESHNAHSGEFPIIFSVGVARRRGGEALEETLRRADRRMYRMKEFQRVRRGPIAGFAPAGEAAL